MLRARILDIPLHEVMRPEIAMPLQQVLRLYTVGNFLNAWQNPMVQKSIEQVFDSPEQARAAAITCAAWLGVGAPRAVRSVPAWWRREPHTLNG
jgi:hypothetical protein